MYMCACISISLSLYIYIHIYTYLYAHLSRSGATAGRSRRLARHLRGASVGTRGVGYIMLYHITSQYSISYIVYSYV